jgi:hypothetical protein
MTCGLCLAAGLALAGCSTTPPTATPGPPPTVDISQGPTTQGTPRVNVVEMTLPAPATGLPVAPQPILIGPVTPYREPGSRFSIDAPTGWNAEPQQVSSTGDIKTAIVFPDPTGNGLVTVTQFDNGKTPAAFGATVNGLLKQTGLTERPGYQELSREQVPDRKDTALRVEVLYERSNGLPMHSMVLFQLDGTTFSLVHAGVEEQSWDENEEQIRQVLRSYKVPAAAP